MAVTPIAAVSWDSHPLRLEYPDGHRKAAGSGDLLGFAPDSSGQLCGIVVLTDGSFDSVPISQLRRSE